MIYVFQRPDSEYSRAIEEFGKELEKRRLSYELIDLNSPGGAAKAQAYDLWQFPAVLVAREPNGQVVQSWTGTLPTIADVEFHARGQL